MYRVSLRMDSSLECGTGTWDWECGTGFQLEHGTGVGNWLNCCKCLVWGRTEPSYFTKLAL